MDGRMVGRATVMTEFRVIALSETGGSFEMEVPMTVGSLFDLSLELSEESIDLRGRVVELSPPDHGRSAYVVAVEFEGSEADAAALNSFLARERGRTL